jgi:hypothetical protein
MIIITVLAHIVGARHDAPIRGGGCSGGAEVSLYTHLTENIIEVNEQMVSACDQLEKAFKGYMTRAPEDEAPLVNAITPWVFDSAWVLKKDIDADIVKQSPRHHIVITQALLYCLEQYGLEEAQKTRRHDLFNIPIIHYLAKQNDCHLIVEMNALRAGKESKKERDEVERQCALYAGNDGLAKELTEFFYKLKHPVEDEDEMQGALNRILIAIKADTENKREAEALAWLRRLMLEKLGADKWTLLSLVYDRYSREQEIKYTTATKTSLLTEDRDELKKVEDTHNSMNTLTKLQAGGMLLGGFTFGIEVGMLILEEAAEEDMLKAWHVLALSAALCLTLGHRLGLFFFRSHIYELQKQLKENYYNAKYGEQDKREHHPISWTAVMGTGAEGLLVLFGLVTSGLFTCDMTTMAIRNAMGYNDKYTTDIFGTYFWNKMTDEGGWGYLVASSASLLIGIAAVGAAVSLTCGHYALDGQETKEYEAKQRKITEMKRVA